MIGAIVFCRLDSQRLPGKVLRPVDGVPLLEYVIRRCEAVTINSNSQSQLKIIVATSDRPVDDPIIQYCQERNISFFRGSLKDVAKRALNCAREYSLESFFRINGDSPFLEPRLLSQACTLLNSSQYDFITNLSPRSFPYGVSVEAIRTKTFKAAYHQMKTDYEYEHITQFFYKNLEKFSYHNLQKEGDNLSHIKLTIDTQEDFRNFILAVEFLKQRWSTFTYSEAVNFYKKLHYCPQ